MPAGGSAAAAAAAMAAGLVEKAARLSTTQWIGAAAAAKRAGVLRRQAARLVDADAGAYTDYVAALRRARGLHTAQREKILASPRRRIVEVPLAIVRAAVEVAELAAEAAEHGNPNLRTDAFTGMQLAASAARSAAATLGTNVASARDERLLEAKRLSARASRLRAPARQGARGRGSTRSRGSGRR